MAKPNGGTRSVNSNNAASTRSISERSSVSSVEQFYNANSGDDVLSITYRDSFRDYDEATQLRIRRKAEGDGYHKVKLPQASNQDVIAITKEVLNSNTVPAKLELEVEAGTREENIAKRYGFKEYGSPWRDEFTGTYYKKYRRG